MRLSELVDNIMRRNAANTLTAGYTPIVEPDENQCSIGSSKRFFLTFIGMSKYEASAIESDAR